MKLYLGLSVVALGVLGASMIAEARGGGHGAHFNGGGWRGGLVPHHYYGGVGRGYGYYRNNYYGGGYGGYGYWPGAYVWPGYITGGPVGYYNTPVRCYKKWVCYRKHQCHWQRICHR